MKSNKKYLTFFSIFILGVLLLTTTGTVIIKTNESYPYDSLYKNNSVEIFKIKNDPWVEKVISEMTLEEKAGQVVFPFAQGIFMNKNNPNYLRLKSLVEDYKVGGLIFFQSEILGEVFITNELQKLAKIPLLISADFERGVAQRVADATLFPYNMGVGAADDTMLTYWMGRVIAAEGLAMGVHQNYAPVMDINNNPFNPIINVRSYGEDKDLVARLGKAFLRGVQDGGMIATIKHFPGHGNTSTDSHNELPRIDGTREYLFNNELYPFSVGLKAGVMSTMIGHLSMPAFEKDSSLPSTLSKSIINDLLQTELGFDGLIVTDAMNMHAITNNYSDAQSSVMAILAGNDCILYPEYPEECVIAIKEALEKGIISEERINKSIRKILILKRWLKLDQNRFVSPEQVMDIVGQEKHWDLATKIARKSITLVKDEKNLIPLSLNPNVKYSHIVLVDNKRGDGGDYFNNALLQRIKLNEEMIKLTTRSTKSEIEKAFELAKKSDVILLSVYLKVRAFQGSIWIDENQNKLIKSLIKLNKPLILLSHGNPYLLMEFPNAKTYLCNYGDTEVSEQALAEAIFGEIDIVGKLPISIPNTPYKYKDGIQLKKSSLLNQSKLNSQEEKERFQNVDNIIMNAIKDTAFPGAVLLIAKDGNVIHHKAFGHYTYDLNERTMSTNTIFDLASVSKVIATTTATMLCIDRGLFSLDDKVIKYIPEFKANGKENITIRNLLLHNSGLPAYKRFYLTCKTAQEVIKNIYNCELEYPTGTKTIYSDLGLITLGKIIEKVSKRTLDKFCKEEIFVPLGMNSTYYNPPKELRNIIAPTEIDNYWRKKLLIGEVHDENSALLNGVAGHAGLFSTASDLSKILQMLLQKGVYQGKQFIKKETVELFTRQQNPESSRAIGWDTNKDGQSSAGPLFSTLSFGHTGYTGTSVWADPTRNVITILLTNRVYPTRENTKIIRLRSKIHSAIIEAIEKK